MTLDIELAGAAARFEADNAALVAYARAHLAPVLVAHGANSPAVYSRLRWHEGHPPRDVVGAYPEIARSERADRDLWIAPGRIAWLRVDELRDLHLRFQWDGTTLAVQGDYYHRLSKNPRADLARRILYRRHLPALRRKRFTRLLYYTVYYPLFWWLEHVRRIHPLHAGAASARGGAVLFAGPSGVGKSTLTVAISASPGGRFLSDTFVLHQGPTLWAVPEPVLLDAWSQRWLGDSMTMFERLVDHEYLLGRDGFTPRLDQVRDSVEVSAVVLPRRAASRFVREISGREAVWRIDAYDDIVNDLRRYRAVASVLELMEPSGLAAARLQSLDRLAAAAPCYEVGLTSGLSQAEAIRTILELRCERDADTACDGNARLQ